MKLRTFESLTLYRFRYVIGYSIIIGLGLFLLLFRLGSLTPALAEPEVTSANSSHLRTIADNPINAPYRLTQAASTKLLGQNAWAVRLPSVLFGIIFVFGIYLFLRNAYTERVAVMGSILAGISSTTLLYSRLGTPAIALAVVFAALLGLSTWIMTSEKVRLRQVACFAIATIAACYTPYGWLWLLLLVIIHPRELRKAVGSASNWVLTAGILVFLLALAPIGYAVIKDAAILKSWVLWPDVIPSLATFGFNLLKIPAAFFWRDSLADPVTHLGNLPLLDIFTTSMVVLGCLTLIFKPTLARTRILLIAGIVGIVINAANPNGMYMALLLPVVSILAAIGLERLLEEWYEMFPRNPFARVGALVPLALIFGMTMYYHVHRSFIAWPKNPDTKAYYQSKLPE